MIYISKLFSPISTGTSAGDIDVGATVKINENGQPVDYLIVNQGLPGDMYDASCDGTWVLRKTIKGKTKWNSTNTSPSSLEGSTIMQTMAGYISDFDQNVQQAIKTVKIPYCVGGSSNTIKSGSDGLQCKIFPISAYELGILKDSNNNYRSYLPEDGQKLQYFLSGESSDAQSKRQCNDSYYVRTPWLQYTYTVNIVNPDGSFNIEHNVSFEYGARPLFILSYDFKFQEVS